MIEAIMYSAIGFLTATLLALLTLPAVWRRAVRLTRKRIEGAIPVSIAEVQADKDEQRALFAVGIRHLEMEVERQQARTAAQYGEIVRQAEALRTRQEAVERLSTDLDALQTEHATVATHRDHLRGELETTTRHLEETRAALLHARSELARTRDAFEDTRTREDELKIEHVALTTLRDTLKDRIGELGRQLTSANALLASERETVRATGESLAIERRRNQEINDELAKALEAQALAQEGHAALQARIEHLTVLAAAPQSATPPSAEAPDGAADTAMLREHISDIAAGVAHLTARLEGPGSPIDALLAGHSRVPGAPPTLADRILDLKAAHTAAEALTAEEARPQGRAVAG
ncbi:hypothetical protein EV667_3104 [Ancylobacter aquaticus]|uniref:Uncharacterized protein n=1 Tax=Ancylobacter aquaticus TaxID=100 RepID=A0A4R1I5R5_ANCAQ|nr:hypothetical protein [Ancylobacter aquaticus]TCK29085.1 hypothetical protein EV667_3104 [Ancylobacter aquaticus]